MWKRNPKQMCIVRLTNQMVMCNPRMHLGVVDAQNSVKRVCSNMTKVRVLTQPIL